MYDDDELHPIPRMDVIDVEATLKGGGAYRGITIATPLSADARSQERLLRKIKVYIEDFHSEVSKRRIGKPRPEKCQIHVGIHPDSDPAIFELLERCRAWVAENDLTLKITTDIGMVVRQ